MEAKLSISIEFDIQVLSLLIVVYCGCDNSCSNLGGSCSGSTCTCKGMTTSKGKGCICNSPLSCDANGNNQACTPATSYYLASISGSDDNSCGACTSPLVCANSQATGCNPDTSYYLYYSSNVYTCVACNSPLICSGSDISGCTGAYYLKTSSDPKECRACGTNCAACTTASNCTACTSTQYYINGGDCASCGSNCGTCTSSGCSACTNPTGYYIASNGTSCTTCSPPLVCTSSAISGCSGAYYLNTSTNPDTCVACGSNCGACTSISCTACTNPTGYYIASNGTSCTTCSSPLICTSSAITGCSGSNYLNSSSNPKTCNSCSSNCTACTASACTQCSSLTSYYISGTTCINCGSPLVCAANVITGCTSGSAYYFNNSTNPYQCVSCGSNCGACTSSACTACTNATGYFINGTSCTTCSSPLVCTSSTISGCTPTTNYYLSSTTNPKSCVPCTAPLTCASSTITGCSGAYYLNGTNCVACQVNCTSCTSSACSACSGAYYPSGNGCVSCPAQCSLCTNSTCSSCVSPCSACNFAACIGCVATNQYIVSPATTCATCPTQCLTCTLTDCQSCVSPCATCSRSACLTCISSSYYVSGITCLACGTPCSGCNASGCTSCPLTNQYITGSNCSTCPTQCLTCTSTACQSCLSPCSTCTRTACLSCISANYYVSGTTCVQCDSTCATCTASGCLTCPNTNQYVSGVGCITCPAWCLTCTSSACQTCVSPCATCTLTGCASCISQDYYLNANVTQCISCSPCPICDPLGSGSGCSACPAQNTYYSGSTCITCPTHCLTCTASTCLTCVAPCYTCSLTACLSCMSTNMFISGTTCGSCDVSCSVCATGGCQSCPMTNQYPSLFSCLTCPTQCLTCNSSTCLTCVSPCSTCTFTACTTCIDPVNYFTSSITCLSCQSPLVCSSSIITGCTGSYYLNTTTNPYSCTPCGNNCGTCISTACSACTDTANYYLNANECAACASPLVCTLSLKTGCAIGSAYYFDSTTSSCTACGTNCALCTSSACTQCTDVTLYYINGINCVSCSNPLVCTSSTITSCAVGTAYYYNSTSQYCIACETNCGLCSSASVCTACTDQTNYYINGANCITCTSPLSCSSSSIIGCISGLAFYFDSTTNPYSCVACGNNCQTCTSSACSACISDTAYFIQGQVCTLCTSPLQCTSSEIIGCDPLQPYYFDTLTTPKSCVSCGINCASCTSTACTSCINISTFYMNGYNCNACSLPLICGNSIITGCSPAYYLDMLTNPYQCIACGTNCQTCNMTACTSCMDPFNYYIVGLNCDPCTAPFVCSSSQTVGCDPNLAFYFDTIVVPATCNPCGTNCALCDSSACTECMDPNNQYLNGINCQTCTSPHICSNSSIIACTSTLPYYFSLNQCLTCPIQCQTCNQTSCQSCVSPCQTCDYTSCSTCIASNYYASGLTCIQCQSTCATCDSTGCLTCPQTNQYPLANVCLTCPQQCLTCTSSTCLTCLNPCATCSLTICLSCISNNYYISGITCLACNPNCATCNSTQCLSCISSQYQVQGSGCLYVCQPNCQTCIPQQCLTCVSLSYYTVGESCNLCENNCLTCSSKSTCLTCDSTAYRTLINNKCECIDQYEDTGNVVCSKISCTSPAARTIQSCQYQDCTDGIWEYGEQCDNTSDSARSGCTKCIIDKGYFCINVILQPSLCYLLPQNCDKATVVFNLPICITCNYGYFLTTHSKCAACDTICNGCINSSQNCLTCRFSLFTSLCYLCESIPGYYSNFRTNMCYTVCGDSVTQGVEQCDDGNQMKGDGCSSVCAIEPGYSCSGTVCEKIQYPIPILSCTTPTNIQTYQNNRTFFITYNDTLKTITNLDQSMIISIPSLSLNFDYTFLIKNGSNAVIEIDFNFSISIQNKTLIILYITSQFTNQYDSQQQIQSQSIAIPDYMMISNTEKQTTESLTIINQYILYFLFGIVGFSLLLGGLETFYNLLDLLQTISYLQFINTNHPYNLQAFLNLFKFAQFSFISQYFNFQQIIGKYVDYSQIDNPPSGIYDEGYLSFTLLNASSILVIWVSAVGIYFIAKVSLKFLTKYNITYGPRDSQVMIRLKTYAMFVQQIIIGICESISAQFIYSGIIRTHQSTAYNYCLMLALGFYALEFSNSVYIINFSSYLTFVLFFIYAGFAYLSFTIAGLSSLTLKQKEQEYGAIYEGTKLMGVAVYQNSFLFVKKFFFMIALVQLYYVPLYQAANVLALSVIQVLIFLLVKPIANFHEKIKQLICECLMVYTEFLLFILCVDDNFDVLGSEMREDIGYGCIAGLILIIITQVGIDIKQQWKELVKIWNQLKKFAHGFVSSDQIKHTGIPQVEFLQ